MITGIEHVAIFARDTKTLSSWYAEMFEGEIVLDNGKGTYFVAFSENSMIEFCKNEEESLMVPALNTPGMRHFAFSTDDFDSAVAKVKAAGVEILKDAEYNDSGVGTMFFRDLEGNVLHLIARPK